MNGVPKGGSTWNSGSISVSGKGTGKSWSSVAYVGALESGVSARGVPTMVWKAVLPSSSISPALISRISCASRIMQCRLSISACSLAMYSSLTVMSDAWRRWMDSMDVSSVTSLRKGVTCSFTNCVTHSLIGVGGVGVRARHW